MNKSTPLNQLQQQSAQVQMPEKPSDILGEDDATIQEVLNQINMQNASAQASQQAPSQMQPPVPQLPQIQAQLPQQSMPHYAPQMQQFPSAQDLYQMQQTSGGMMSPPQNVPVSSGLGTIDMFMTLFAEDVKLAVLVFGCVVVAHFIPASSILNKYIAIDKIPYHDVIIRAIICALLVIVLKKLLFK